MFTPDRQLDPPNDYWGDELNEIINEDNYMLEKENLEEENNTIEQIVEPIEEVVLKRSFGGKINNFESKGEQEFEKRHLKAYLKGHKNFRCGFRTNSNGMREENVFNVIENWK